MNFEKLRTTGVETMLAQLGCEERDNKFQEQIAEQFLVAQQALAASHHNVLQQLARKLHAMRHVEVENQLLVERIAAIGGPSSSSSSYVKAAETTEGSTGRPGSSSMKVAENAIGSTSRHGSLTAPLPGNMLDIEPKPPASFDPQPPPQQTLTAIVPEGDPLHALPGAPDDGLDTCDSERGSIQEVDTETAERPSAMMHHGSMDTVHSMGSVLYLPSMDAKTSIQDSKASQRSSKESFDGMESDNMPTAFDISTRSCPVLTQHEHENHVSWFNGGNAEKVEEITYRESVGSPEQSCELSLKCHEHKELATLCEISHPLVGKQSEKQSLSSRNQLIRSATEGDHIVMSAPMYGTEDSYRRVQTERCTQEYHPAMREGRTSTNLPQLNPQFHRVQSAKMKNTHGKFELLLEWQIEDPEEYYRTKMGQVVRRSTKDNRDLIRKATQAGLAKTNEEHNDSPIMRRLRKSIIHPCGVKRAAWDMLSLALVTYDMAILPLQFFDPPPSTFLDAMAWSTRIFWTIDMPMSIGTGYLLSDGSIQMHPGEVAKRYLLTWFGLDILLVLLDWMEVVIGTDESSAASDYGRIGKMGRTFRILRMVRLLRLVRMREIIKLITFRMQSERLVIMADIAKILMIIIAVAHLMACFWYGISDEDNPADSWIGTASFETLVVDMPLELKYLISMHWAVSQFSGGMDEFRAANFRERLYNVTVFLAAFMMAAVCVSGLTSSMTRLHILSSHQSRQLSTLRRYLIQNGISDRLALRVQRNALHAISEQQRLMAEKHVELLSAVSEPLRVELHFEMYSPVLEVHPFFRKYVEECPQVMMRVCHQAMSTLLVSSGDIIFNAGEIPESPKMYIVCNGQMEYIPHNGSVSGVNAEEWLSEGALWTHWMHRGVLKAKSDGRLCLLDSRKFSHIVMQFDHPEFDPREYASEYVKMINDMQDEKTITDLKIEDQEDLVESYGQMKTQPSAKFGARQLLGQIAGTGRQNMMDAPKRRESVLFVPSKTTKLKRGLSKNRLLK